MTPPYDGDDRRRIVGDDHVKLLIAEMINVALKDQKHHLVAYIDKSIAGSEEKAADRQAAVIERLKRCEAQNEVLAQSLHRIDPRFVCEDMRRQGFEFVGASDLLANPEDPLTGSVFEPGIQGRTSRFVHRYRKPAQAAPITPPAGCDRSAGN